MKIYTQVIDIALQSPKRFWVAPYSDFKIGVKIVRKGTPVANEFTVKQGSTTLTADADKVDGFTTYTIKSGSTGSVEYAVEVAGVAEKQKITQIVTDSTVFDVGGAGGGSVPADVATQSWVQTYVSAQTSEFVDGNYVEQAISAATSTFVTASEVESAISTATSEFVTASEVEVAISTATSTFVTASEVEEAISTATSTFVNATQVSEAISAATSDFTTTSDVEAAISTATTDMATQTWVGGEISAFVTDAEMSTAISTATTDMATQTWVGGQISGLVSGGGYGQAPKLSAMTAVYETDWATLSATADANTFYVVLPDPV